MIRVATYNFYCRPRLTFYDNQVTRAKLLASEIVNYEKKDGEKIDVICFQEIVDNKVHKILKKELKKIGFIFRTKRLDTFWRLNGGVLIYSRFPIIRECKMIFDVQDACLWNAPASKGASMCKILKNARCYNIVDTHLDSFEEKFRKVQMENIKEWIDEMYIPETEPIIICGDFNIDFYSKEKDNITNIFDFKYAKLNTENSCSIYSMDHKNSWVQRRITSKNDPDLKDELLDFFFYDSNDIQSADMKIVDLRHEQKANDICCSSAFFANVYTPWKCIKIEEMSDHYMVICDFKCKSN